MCKIIDDKSGRTFWIVCGVLYSSAPPHPQYLQTVSKFRLLGIMDTDFSA